MQLQFNVLTGPTETTPLASDVPNADTEGTFLFQVENVSSMPLHCALVRSPGSFRLS